jgi:catechol 2,3-dioxygenase-like lactoylglutathione lyase family enzyme
MQKLGPIGQVSRPVSDIDRSVSWYRDVLGLPHLYTYGDLAFFDCAGTRLYLNRQELAADPDDSTVIYFRVDDIQAAYGELGTRGVEFVDTPHRIHTHADGTEEWMVFFRDPDGHLLALMSQVAPAG